MATKKNEEKKSVAPLWAALPEDAARTVDLDAVKVPAHADSVEMLVAARVVMDSVPEPRPAAVQAAWAEMAETCDLAGRALEHNDAVNVEKALEQGGARRDLIGATVSVTGILKLLASSGIPALAEEGRAVEITIFNAVPEPALLSGRALYGVMQGVDAKLTAQPALRARLVALVPEVLVEHLRTATARLGAELGVGIGRAQEPLVSKRVLRRMLRERLSRLVKVLAATAALGDRTTEMAVRKQLRPVIELAAAVTPRARAEADDDADAVPVTGSPVPVTGSPVPVTGSPVAVTGSPGGSPAAPDAGDTG